MYRKHKKILYTRKTKVDPILPFELIASFIDFAPSLSLNVCDYLHLFATCRHFFDLSHYDEAYKKRMRSSLLTLAKIHKKIFTDVKKFPKQAGIHWKEYINLTILTHALSLETLILNEWKEEIILAFKDTLDLPHNGYTVYEKISHLLTDYNKETKCLGTSSYPPPKGFVLDPEAPIDRILSISLIHAKDRIESMHNVKVHIQSSVLKNGTKISIEK
jgi:hypothetical protein